MRIILLSIILIGFVSTAQAQFTGAGSDHGYNFMTVKDATKQAVSLDKNDDKVTLEGYILKRVGEKEYLFKDGTGDITLLIEDQVFPKQKFNGNVKIRVWGQIDIGHPLELEVDKIKIIGN